MESQKKDKRPQFHIKTPLIYSHPFSKRLGRKVYLKLDFLQPSGSFKIRGIGRACADAVGRKDGCTRLVGSSGGNAGVAMSYAALGLKTPLSLFIPKNANQVIKDILASLDPEGDILDIRMEGINWNEANEAAEKLMASDSSARFIHPFDAESVWEGNSTIVDEIKDQLAELGEESDPSGIATCVGGGGLAAGIVLGMQRHGWTETALIAMETTGANCFNEALKANKLVKLDAIRSIASSLGALEVTEKLLKQNQEHPIISRVITDKQALQACLDFASDHRILVEPACGASLCSVYNFDSLDFSERLDSSKPLVIVVCGGNQATFELFEKWKNQFGMN